METSASQGQITVNRLKTDPEVSTTAYKKESPIPIQHTKAKEKTSISQRNNPTPAPSEQLFPHSNSEFTKQTTNLLNEIGIDAKRVNPQPLGIGANHIVYEYIDTDEKRRVIKLTRPGGALSKMNKGISEEENIDLMQKTFGDFFPKTEIKKM